jgi:hypothetical protein
LGDVPETQNPTLSVVDSVLHGLMYDVAIQAAITYAKAQFPFLGLPVISTLFGWVVNWIAGLVYVQLERFVSFSIIDTQVGQENSKYNQAVEDLKKAHQGGDLVQIDQAKKEARDALAQLIHYGGS